MITYRKGTTIHSTTALLLATILAMAAAFLASCNKGNEQTDSTWMKTMRALDDSIAFRSPKARFMADSCLARAKDSIEFYDCQLRLARLFISDSKTDSASATINRTMAFLKGEPKTPHTRGMEGFAYNCRGVILHTYRRGAKEAVANYRRAYETSMESDRMECLPDICANLADAYSFDSDLPNAAAWYRRALFLSDSLQLPHTRNISLYMGLGRVYMMLEDYDSAKKNFDASERMFNQISPEMQIYLVTSIGNYHYYKKEYLLSLKQFERLELLLRKLKMEDSYSMFICRVNMADVLLNLGRLDEAQENVDAADRYFTQADDSVALYYTHSVELGLALRKGDMATAKHLAALKDKPESAEPGLRIIRNKYLTGYYEASGNYAMALATMKREKDYNDSLVHNRQHMIAAELMTRFSQDTLQLHHQIEMQHKENDVKEAHSIIIGTGGALLLLVLVIICGITYIRKKQLDERIRIFKLRLQNARNRISPHFVFNVLNNRITAAGNKEADELLALSKLIRANLDLTGKEMTSVEEEMDFVESYIDVERKTIGDDFEYSLLLGKGIDRKELESFMIPSMSIQILVENSIKHALRGKSGPKRLTIEICSDGTEGLDVTVSDNGKGFDIRHTTPGQGLDILKTTISVMNQRNKRKTSMTVKNNQDENGNITGCTTRIHFPKGLRSI